MHDLIPAITGSSGAIVVLAVGIWLFLTGRLHSDREFRAVVKDRDDYKAALEIERVTNNELARAGTVTTKVLDVLAEVASGRHGQPSPDGHQPVITSGNPGT